MDVDSSKDAQLYKRPITKYIWNQSARITNDAWVINLINRGKKMCGFDNDDYIMLKKRAEIERKILQTKKDDYIQYISVYSNKLTAVNEELSRVDRTIAVCDNEIDEDDCD